MYRSIEMNPYNYKCMLVYAKTNLLIRPRQTNDSFERIVFCLFPTTRRLCTNIEIKFSTKFVARCMQCAMKFNYVESDEKTFFFGRLVPTTPTRG